jgi:hypothetical protein
MTFTDGYFSSPLPTKQRRFVPWRRYITTSMNGFVSTKMGSVAKKKKKRQTSGGDKKKER